MGAFFAKSEESSSSKSEENSSSTPPFEISNITNEEEKEELPEIPREETESKPVSANKYSKIRNEKNKTFSRSIEFSHSIESIINSIKRKKAKTEYKEESSINTGDYSKISALPPLPSSNKKRENSAKSKFIPSKYFDKRQEERKKNMKYIRNKTRERAPFNYDRYKFYEEKYIKRFSYWNPTFRKEVENHQFRDLHGDTALNNTPIENNEKKWRWGDWTNF